MEQSVIIIFIAFLLFSAYLGYKAIRYNVLMKDVVLERIEFAEKEVDDDARFFACAVYKSGRVEMITKDRLTEEQAIQVASKFVDEYKPNKPKFW